jgi:hypothetical protein
MPDELDRDLLRLFVQGDLDAFESPFKQFEVDGGMWPRNNLVRTQRLGV